MPEISRFYGIIIRMYWDEHNPPHFHAFYGSDEVLVEIHSLSVLSGKLPPRALGLAIEWATSHQLESCPGTKGACQNRSTALNRLAKRGGVT